MMERSDDIIAPTTARALTGQQALEIAVGELAANDSRYAQLQVRSGLSRQMKSTFGHEFDTAVQNLIRLTAISFDSQIYGTLPTLRPYAIRDSRRRGGTNSLLWGVPREDGYFSDDNSLLKKLPRELTIRSANPHFDGRRVDNGWTACHAWRALSDGRQSSSFGLLNSFSPVLIWLPSALASPTDVEGSVAQFLLKCMASSFKMAPVSRWIKPYVDRSWELLDPILGPSAVGTEHRFTYSDKFVGRRVASMRKVAGALRNVSAIAQDRIVSRRYTNGLAALEPDRARLLSLALEDYADSVECAMGIRREATFSPFPE